MVLVTLIQRIDSKKRLSRIYGSHIASLFITLEHCKQSLNYS